MCIRDSNKTERLLTAGDVTVDVEARRVTRAGRNVELTNKEFGLSLIHIFLGLHIGAFEYSPGGYGVQVTKQIFPLMELQCEDENNLYVDEKVFLSRLSDMQRCPVPEENGIYRISGKTERWVRITLSLRHGHSLGIIEDVTGDMMKKQRKACFVMS